MGQARHMQGIGFLHEYRCKYISLLFYIQSCIIGYYLVNEATAYEVAVVPPDSLGRLAIQKRNISRLAM